MSDSLRMQFRQQQADMPRLLFVFRQGCKFSDAAATRTLMLGNTAPALPRSRSRQHRYSGTNSLRLLILCSPPALE